ncbi:HD domain-containing protein [Desulfatiglans anilini]|uniref:HD domain-containing protein n=1 Tax=Desulfatiglans anilini TaxID=90728 RepID=UPI0003F8398C|nr:HD domain-containing protein [Desulfatiglans anilini]
MKCPGQDSRYWKPGAIFEAKCPECGNTVEFFKDDTTRLCKACGHRMLNPNMDFGCAAYCRYAEQCIGNLPPELLAQKENLLKDRVAIEMKRYFKRDFKRIGHAGRVARYAERIGKEEAGNLAVILSAAYLHDVGITVSEEKHPGESARDHEEEGVPVARGILEGLGAREELIEEVCDIIAHHHHPRAEEDIEFKCVYDADLIANLEEKHKEEPLTEAELERTIADRFYTGSGKALAREVLMGGQA